MGYLFWGLISIQSLPGSLSPSHYIQPNYQVSAKLFQPPLPLKFILMDFITQTASTHYSLFIFNTKQQREMSRSQSLASKTKNVAEKAQEQPRSSRVFLAL